MLKKIIQILLILILLSILTLIAIFVFNPGDLRTKLINRGVNSFLENTLEDYTPLDPKTIDSNEVKEIDHPLLNESQEEALKKVGVDVSQLPSEISEAMQDCFIEKLGAERANELVAGATPGPLDIFKAKSCLSK